MLRLVAFGGLRLEDETGPVEGRASQKRRLALLALLATPPIEVVTRDKLIGYLWPERGQERARALLSSALYDLRKELGEDVIDTPGDGVAVDPGRLTSDAALFMEAIEAGDVERAVGLYGGPFLDGVHLSGTAEFEHWVSTERQRYLWAFREALETLARERAAAGDLKGAADAWRRLAVEDPASTKVALGYMEALSAAGHRAKALEFARVHTALLREEYDAEPAPEIAALVERLRAEPEPVAEPERPPEPELPEGIDGGREADASEAAAPSDPGASRPPEPDAAEPGGRDAPVAAPVGAGPAGDRGSGRRPARVAALVVAVAAAAAVAVAAIWMVRDRPEPGAPIPVAVLPFENLSAEEGSEYFADGLTEEILNALRRLEAFRVSARTSAFAFKGRQVTVQEVGRELGVDYVVTGSVRREDDALRIGVSLANTGTGYELWGDTYDRPVGSVFTVQEGIARSVVGALMPRLVGTLPPRLVTVPENLEAYDAYLKARAHWHERTPEALQRALTDLRRAIELDPTYALAYAGVADVYNLLGAYEYGVVPPYEAYPAARDSADRALQLDPELAEGHAALANILFNYEWDWEEAERRYRRALDLNPGFAMAHHWYSLLLRAEGRDEESLAEIRRARQLDPKSPIMSTSLARHYYFAGDTEAAIEEYRNALALDSTFVIGHLGLGLAAMDAGRPQLALEHYTVADGLLGGPTPVVAAVTAHALGTVGRTAEARVLYDGLLDARRRAYVPPHYLAVAAIGLGELGEAVGWFEAALEERSGSIIYLRLEPVVDPLRVLPEFQALLDRAEERGLPPMTPPPIGSGSAP